MLTVDSLRARAARLQQLNLGLAEEVARWKKLESPLLDAERQAYLNCIQDGIAGLDAAWHAAGDGRSAVGEGRGGKAA